MKKIGDSPREKPAVTWLCCLANQVLILVQFVQNLAGHFWFGLFLTAVGKVEHRMCISQFVQRTFFPASFFSSVGLNVEPVILTLLLPANGIFSQEHCVPPVFLLIMVSLEK